MKDEGVSKNVLKAAADYFADISKRERRLKAELDIAEKALEKYTHCRHASIACFCTNEAVVALDAIEKLRAPY